MSLALEPNSNENEKDSTTDDVVVFSSSYADANNTKNNDNDMMAGTLDDNETESDSDDESVGELPTWGNNHSESDDDGKDPYMDEWQCPECTLIQHISYRICDACGASAPDLSVWQQNMITEWDNMGDCVFYDSMMDICNNNYDINLSNEQEFNAFMDNLQSIGIQSDHSKTRALLMLEMILQQNTGTDEDKKDSNKQNYNPSKVMVKKALDEATSLKQWMKHNQIWEKDLFLVLVEFGVSEVPHHLYLIDSWSTFHNIIRKVRVLRKKNLKSAEAQKRLDKLCTKFEKLWKIETGFKYTSIKSSQITANNLPKNVFVNSPRRKLQTKKLKKVKKDFREKKKARTRSKEALEQKGKPLKHWMQSNHIWQLTLYQQLLTMKETQQYLSDPTLMLSKITETLFDDIVRKVRVERFSQLKDNKARLQCDNTLLKFEKLWRKTTGIKKTSIR